MGGAEDEGDEGIMTGGGQIDGKALEISSRNVGQTVKTYKTASAGFVRPLFDRVLKYSQTKLLNKKKNLQCVYYRVNRTEVLYNAFCLSEKYCIKVVLRALTLLQWRMCFKACP